MAYLLLVILLFLLIVLQSALLPALGMQGVRPDMVLLAVVGWGLAVNPRQALLGAILGGLLLDLFSTLPQGTSLLALLPVAVMTELREVDIIGGRLALTPLLTFLGSLMYYGIALFILYVTGRSLNAVTILTNIVIPATMMNTLLSLPTLWLILTLAHWARRWRSLVL